MANRAFAIFFMCSFRVIGVQAVAKRARDSALPNDGRSAARRGDKLACDSEGDGSSASGHLHARAAALDDDHAVYLSSPRPPRPALLPYPPLSRAHHPRALLADNFH